MPRVHVPRAEPDLLPAAAPPAAAHGPDGVQEPGGARTRGSGRAAPDPREVWVERHQRALWRYLLYLGAGREAAEDLLQETLLAGLRHGVHAAAEGVARAWLRTTARRLLVDRARRERRSLRTAELDAADAVWRQQDTEPRLQALRECLAQLDGRGRRALELRYGEGLDRAAIAAELGLGEEGVKSLLHRTRQALRLCIERRCDDGR